jgi:hypothetical protein
MSDYYPTPLDSERVIKLKRAGILNHRIADILRVSLETLEKYFPVELGFTDEEDLAVVANVAFAMASSGVDANMTKWWLAVKGGWNEKAPPQSGLDSPLLIILADGTDASKALIEDAEFTEIDPP